MVSASLQASSTAESASQWALVWSLENDGYFNGGYKVRHSKVGDPSGWKKETAENLQLVSTKLLKETSGKLPPVFLTHAL